MHFPGKFGILKNKIPRDKPANAKQRAGRLPCRPYSKKRGRRVGAGHRVGCRVALIRLGYPMPAGAGGSCPPKGPAIARALIFH